MDYQKYLQSDHWKKKRRAAIKFYGGTCCICGREDDLNVHHRNYDNLNNEHIAHDLIVLCHDCHSCFHGKYPDQKEFSIIDYVFMRLSGNHG